jgi:ATP-dependent DNA ligase
VVGEGRALLAATAELGLEGVIAKRLDSPYQPGVRSRDWVKVKRVARQELVVGGWMPGKGKRGESIGALLGGVHEDGGRLRYVGRVGSGFSDSELQRLSGLLAPLHLAIRFRGAAAGRRALLRAAPRRRGRVRELDLQGQPARGHVQGPAR